VAAGALTRALAAAGNTEVMSHDSANGAAPPAVHDDGKHQGHIGSRRTRRGGPCGLRDWLVRSLWREARSDAWPPAAIDRKSNIEVSQIESSVVAK
jgi:hypothetical protein